MASTASKKHTPPVRPPVDPDDPRWLEYVPVDDLPEDPRNPKGHDEVGLDASLDRFGYTDPVELDERTGLLVSGHGRKQAIIRRREAIAAGEDKPVPNGVVVRDGVWLVPVVRGWASADDDDAAAYLVGANHLTELGGWRPEPLALLLEGLRDRERLDGTGYAREAVDDMLAKLRPPSLDDLADRYGEPDPSALWPVLKFQVPPEVRDRYMALVGDRAEDDRFVALLDLAEAGHDVWESEGRGDPAVQDET